jgi:hypothetical protein
MWQMACGTKGVQEKLLSKTEINNKIIFPTLAIFREEQKHFEVASWFYRVLLSLSALI